MEKVAEPSAPLSTPRSADSARSSVARRPSTRRPSIDTYSMVAAAIFFFFFFFFFFETTTLSLWDALRSSWCTRRMDARPVSAALSVYVYVYVYVRVYASHAMLAMSSR